MPNLAQVPDALLEPPATVVAAILEAAPSLNSHDVMLLGAGCRDILHHALGHGFATAATRDLDLALALATWDSYLDISDAFPRLGGTGIRYRIAGLAVDLIPFGGIEHPPGTTEIPPRADPVSVWAFTEIFAAALPIALPAPGLEVRIPTVPGFAAAKLGAWLDRAEYNETKDAADLALILHWYAEAPAIQDRLYETEPGNSVLIAEGADVQRAAARLLGADVARLLGTERRTELLHRWPGRVALLTRSLRLRGGPAWPSSLGRRLQLVDALTRGLITANTAEDD